MNISRGQRSAPHCSEETKAHIHFHLATHLVPAAAVVIIVVVVVVAVVVVAEFKFKGAPQRRGESLWLAMF